MMNDKRDAYVAKLKARLDVWNAELNQLEARTHEVRADVRIKYQEQADNLRHRRDQAKLKLTEMQNATGNAWEELRRGADDAWHRLEEAGAKAAVAFKQ
jgi:hypothetical protein